MPDRLAHLVRRLGVTALTVLLAGSLVGCGDTSAAPAHSATQTSEPVPTAVVGREVSRVRMVGASDVLVTRQDHRRGGWQVRLYVRHGGVDAPLTGPGHSLLVPFVATDTRPETPVSADCTQDGFAVTVAQPTSPTADPPTWEVRRTTYRISGDSAIPAGVVRLGVAVPDRRLRTQHPDLFAHVMFLGCPTALPQ